MEPEVAKSFPKPDLFELEGKLIYSRRARHLPPHRAVRHPEQNPLFIRTAEALDVRFRTSLQNPSV